MPAKSWIPPPVPFSASKIFPFTLNNLTHQHYHYESNHINPAFEHSTHLLVALPSQKYLALRRHVQPAGIWSYEIVNGLTAELSNSSESRFLLGSRLVLFH